MIKKKKLPFKAISVAAAINMDGVVVGSYVLIHHIFLCILYLFYDLCK